MKKQGFNVSFSRDPGQAVLSAATVGSVIFTIAIAGAATFNVARWQQAAHHFDLYASKRGAPLTEMRRTVRAGPFPDLAICLTVGALSIDVLGAQHPDRDFMGRCDDGDLLDMRPMYDRAMRMLREEPKP